MAMAAYQTWADETGRQLLEFATNSKLYSPAGKAINAMPTEGWPLTSFASAFAISLGYFAFVVLGRAVMSFLPAMDKYTYPLRFVYNIAQVMLCSYMTVEAGIVAYRNGYSITPCNAFVTSGSPPIAPVLWLFYVSKVFDFFDTFFIIAGKKWQQLSFLHVYHHLTIFLVYWMNVSSRPFLCWALSLKIEPRRWLATLFACKTDVATHALCAGCTRSVDGPREFDGHAVPRRT
jgi:elongation of very long chain fatty acids protein 4